MRKGSCVACVSVSLHMAAWSGNTNAGADVPLLVTPAELTFVADDVVCYIVVSRLFV